MRLKVLALAAGLAALAGVAAAQDNAEIVVTAARYMDNDSGAAFIRNILELSDGAAANPLVQVVSPGTPIDKLFTAGVAAVVTIAPASKIVKDKSYEQYAKRGGLTLNTIEAAKLLTRKYPALSEETVESGTLSSSPAIPEEDIETVGFEWLLVTQSEPDYWRARPPHL